MEFSGLRQASKLWPLIRRFAPYLRRVSGRALVSAALVIVAPLVAAALLWLVKLLIDEVFVGGRVDLLAGFVAVYVALVAGKFLLGYVETRLEASVVEQIVQDARVDLYRHLISLSPGSLRKHSVGDLLTHLSGDVERLEYLVYTGLLAVFADAVGALFFVGFLFLLSWKLTLCALIVTPPLILLSLSLSPRVRRAARIARRQVSAWMALAEERLGAQPVVHAFAAHEREAHLLADRAASSRRAELRTVAVQAWLSLLIEAIVAVGGLAVLVVGAYEIRSGSLTLGTLVAFLGSIGSLYGPVRGLAKASGRFQRAAAGAQRVADLLDTPSLVTEKPSAAPLRHARGALEFRNVHFAYPQGPAVLGGVSLRLDPGETVAVVGPSGAGKSTLVRLALRLHDPASGDVLIDGTDLRDVTLASLRQAVAVVFQEPYLLRGSIADNIRYGGSDAEEERVAAVARAAHVEGFANALRGGYAAPVGPRGAWLSGGQAQRVALARALLRDSPILLLDEATAAVDSETEELIQDAVERLAGRRTILIVAHRLSSLRRADRVVVLDRGRVVESGPPDVLLKTPTRCRDLFAAQLVSNSAAA